MFNSCCEDIWQRDLIPKAEKFECIAQPEVGGVYTISSCPRDSDVEMEKLCRIPVDNSTDIGESSVYLPKTTCRSPEGHLKVSEGCLEVTCNFLSSASFPIILS